MADALNFYEVSANELPALARLHKKSFGAAAWSRDQLAQSLSLATTYALAVSKGVAPCGVVLCQHVGEEAEILTLCIDPDSQRQGMGLSLLRMLRETLRQKGTHYLRLDVADDNAPAFALYKKAGFIETGLRKGYYKRLGHTANAVTMEIVL